jgi:O-acetyl-ADP-ribose deacetylase (regulator of RNase III)
LAWGTNGEPEFLASCYARSLQIAISKNAVSIAFPTISTGIYGYAIELAAKVVIDTVRVKLLVPSRLQEVVFCCFSESDQVVYEALLGNTDQRPVPANRR